MCWNIVLKNGPLFFLLLLSPEYSFQIFQTAIVTLMQKKTINMQ